ncbi:type III-A CRISPR-associated protein Cas10/Csm1 [Thermosipho sp. 1244]|nr:type III-A CRISPR-associated protein Cas10/Csm1 [Thermosipho sp. 1244]
MMGFTVEKVFLASIFHDIGKFYQRAEINSLKKIITETYRYSIESSKSYSPRHQEWGAYFYKNSGLPYKDEIEGVILNHHSPINLLSELVQLADHVSANEREDYNPSENKRVKNMVSTLSLVSLKYNKKNKKYKKVSRLSEFKELIDREEENIKLSYKNLWNEFEEQVKNIVREHQDAEKLDITDPFFEKIYYLLKEYTSNVPSAFFYSEPEISLFSHLSTTAAIAISIFKQYEDGFKSGDINLFKDVKSDKKIIGIVKGDVSGIQNFIYNVSQEHAVKKLRGRSFYVSYLLEIIARYIIHSEKLSISNVIYNGGGHFYILGPANLIDRLSYYQEKIEENLFKAHGIELTVNLSGEKISLNELSGELFKNISEKVEDKKFRKFESILTKNYEEVFNLKDISQNLCPYCHRELIGEKCEFCESFAELGDFLTKKNSFKILKTNKKVEKINSYNDIFNLFGYEIKFGDNLKDSYLTVKDKKIDFGRYIYFIKSANYVPKKDDGSIADLETIANNSNGIKKWGVLRGDVDNLGKVFGKGLGDKPPISKKATLSQEIEIFFGKFLEDIVRGRFPNSSVIYSGGDDFFILGPWSDLPKLAWEIQKSLKSFSGGNKDITVSMAMEFAPAKKYPVYRVALNAGNNLDIAKDYKRNGYEKNAFFNFNKVVGWEEFEEYNLIKEKLESFINKNITRKVLYVLRHFTGENRKIWRLFYYFSRLADRNKEIGREILEFLDLILRNDNRLYKHIDSITYWVEYETREG